MQREKAENEEKKPPEKIVNDIGQIAFVGIARLRVRVKSRKTRVCGGVTSRAGLHQIRFVNGRCRIGFRQIFMRRVTIDASRGDPVAGQSRLPVKRVAVARRLLLVAAAAFINHQQAEIARRKRRFVMRNRGVTINADGRIFPAFFKRRSV